MLVKFVAWFKISSPRCPETEAGEVTDDNEKSLSESLKFCFLELRFEDFWFVVGAGGAVVTAGDGVGSNGSKPKKSNLRANI